VRDFLLNETPLISIITPSYNQAQYLEKTLRSVLEQDYPNIEYIVVDGNSDDGSQEIIDRYAERLAWSVSEPDRGQADAVNKGLARATGKYIGWLNSDDLYLPGAVRQAVDLLEANPQVGFVYGDVQAIDEHGAVTNIMRYADWNLEDLMGFHIIGQPGVFIRKETLDRAGKLDLSFHYLLDHQLWLRLGLEAGMRYSGAQWAAARFHASAKNVAQADAFGSEAYRLAEWIASEPRFAALYARLWRKVQAGACRMDARYLLDSGKSSAALRTYMRGLKLNPATVLPEWHRMLYALFSPLGLSFLKNLYLKIRFWLKRPDRFSQNSSGRQDGSA
jgi:glycosyltransferase involved in cell wall biosynthesis